MFLLPPNVFWSFQAVLFIAINKFTPTWVSPDVLSLPSFSHSIWIYDGNYLPFSCLGSDSENFQATDRSLLSVPVLGLPHSTRATAAREALLHHFAPSMERPYGWVGTDSMSASETAEAKSQQEQTLQGFKPTNSKEFLLCLCKLKFFKAGFSEKQYCWYKNSSSSKDVLQNRGLDTKILR